MHSLQETPNGNRTHIVFYGATNSGKSSLMNALSKQELSLVSPVAGTTTDPVQKTMEISGLGPCVLIDTAGFDDASELGTLRIGMTEKTKDKADISLLVLDVTTCNERTIVAYEQWKKNMGKTPSLLVLNKCDLLEPEKVLEQKTWLNALFEEPVLLVSSLSGEGILALIQALVSLAPHDATRSITENLCKSGDTVILVMPQDDGAPKGRLILPQAQTTRELLDKHCIIISVVPEELENALARLKEPPTLIITDSQAFQFVSQRTPKETALTSFSVLFACLKGDVEVFLSGAKAIDTLKPNSKVLIAEACTHAPMTEDIGRVKIPAMLRKRIAPELTVDVVSGSDFKEDLSQYDLIIHCGACMFNRKHVLTRVERAKESQVPMTNYGIAMAHLLGILDRVVYPV